MSIIKLIGSLGVLAGVEDADRVDRQNVLVYLDELKGGTPFDKRPGEKTRSRVLFRGFPRTPRVKYLKDLVRYAELVHYSAEGKSTEAEDVEKEKLYASLVVAEADNPEVAEVMSVEAVAEAAGQWG